MEIPNIPDYIIYENGDIYSKERVIIKNNGKKQTFKSQLIKPSADSGGYLKVGLYVDKKRTYHNVHRLLAMAYIPNPDNLPCVNHIDTNKLNNSIENLEWCTQMYNSQSINTSRNFGCIWKTPSNTYNAQYISNGIKHRKNFKKESDAVVHLVIGEIFTKFEAQL